MLKYRKSKAGLQRYVNDNKEFFGSIDEDSYNAAKVLLGSKSSLKGEKQESGGINMCKALDDLYQDGVNQGIEQGIEQGVKALMQDYMEEGYDQEKILDKLQKIFSLSRKKAEEYYVKFNKA